MKETSYFYKCADPRHNQQTLETRMWQLWQSRPIISIIVTNFAQLRYSAASFIAPHWGGWIRKEYFPGSCGGGPEQDQKGSAYSSEKVPGRSQSLVETVSVVNVPRRHPQRRMLPGVLSLERNTPCRKLLGDLLSEEPSTDSYYLID